jgi:hypothetical protein
MVKFEIRDDALMVLNAAPGLVKGSYQLATPGPFQDSVYGKLSLPNHDLVRTDGLHNLALGALQLAAMNHLSADGQKVWFRTTGVLKAASSAYAASQTYRGKKRDGFGYSEAATFGVLAALNLWRGFKRENSKIKL